MHYVMQINLYGAHRATPTYRVLLPPVNLREITPTVTDCLCTALVEL